MSTDQPNTGKKVTDEVTASKSKVYYWVAVALVLLVIAAVFFFNRGTGKIVPEGDKKTEALFHRDEPTEPQIFQGDYRQKVREMLDSGKSPMEISKETKIRIDEVRKIKREYTKGK